MSDTRSVTLAYPYTDADGTAHQPDETVDLPLLEAKNLISDGLAREPSNDDVPVEPAPEQVAVVLAYPYDGHEPDETVSLPAEVAETLLEDGLARLPQDNDQDAVADQKPGYDASIPVITAYVGDDKALAQEYLDAENAKPEPRSTLVTALEAIVTEPDA